MEWMLLLLAAVVLSEGQVLTLPPSFLSHNSLQHHNNQVKDHPNSYNKQRHISDSDENNKNVERKFSPSNKHSVDDALETMHKQPAIRVSNEPHKEPTKTVSTFCNVEISTKIPGNCITVGQLGRACVAGDYLDLFSVDCM
ncbi:hypothetical protein ACFFRR_009970 [Megaselia abdita]